MQMIHRRGISDELLGILVLVLAHQGEGPTHLSDWDCAWMNKQKNLRDSSALLAAWRA